MAAGKGGVVILERERACFSVIENRGCCLVGGAREEEVGEEELRLSFSFSLLGFRLLSPHSSRAVSYSLFEL